jgi:hypothetical protein
MSFRTDLRDLMAASAKAAQDVLGDTVSYTNRAASAVTGLTAHPGPESRELAEAMGLRIEQTAREFEIPRQTSFPPSDGINIGDKVTFDSKDYRVERWEDISEGYEALFKLSCSRMVASKAGI